MNFFNLFLFSDYRNKDLFRLIGLHRLSHFTLVVLHGACIRPNDPHCKLLSLYPVRSFRRQFYDKKKRRLGERSKGMFCSLEFPETFKLWKKAVHRDDEVRKVLHEPRGNLKHPEYGQPLEVVYTTAKHLPKLKKEVKQALEECHMRAVNMDGCLLQGIGKRGCQKNVGAVLAINDILEPDGAHLPDLERAMRRVIAHFVQAVVVAGLPSGKMNVFILCAVSQLPVVHVFSLLLSLRVISL